MQDESSLRHQLGLSQELLANLLGISRDLLAQYELGRRGIPTNALLRLTRLEILLQNTSARTAANLDSSVAGAAANGNQKILAFAKQCLFEAEKETQKLAVMEKKVAQGKLALQIIPGFRKEMANDAVGTATLNLLEQKARQKIKKHQEESLNLLRIRIRGLQYQAAEALAAAG